MIGEGATSTLEPSDPRDDIARNVDRPVQGPMDGGWAGDGGVPGTKASSGSVGFSLRGRVACP